MNENNIGISGYELSRVWFDFCFDNPEKIAPIHTALYFFCIEHCNRLGWKAKFGLPTTVAMEALGIKSYNTYIKTLNELIDFGFLNLIQKSKNQYSSNIVALSKNNKALNKALDKALTKHLIKHSESTGESKVSINKPDNLEPNNHYLTHEKNLEILDEQVREDIMQDRKVSIQNCHLFTRWKGDPYATGVIRAIPNGPKTITVPQIWDWMDRFMVHLTGQGVEKETAKEFQRYFFNWIKIEIPKQQAVIPKYKSGDKLPSGENAVGFIR